MNKKVWTILLSVLLIVTMSVCLFACNGTTTTTNDEGSSSFKIRDGQSGSAVTKSVQVSTNASFAVSSTEAIEGKVFEQNIKFVNKSGEAVAYSPVVVDSKNFKINAPKAGYSAGWYEIELLDSRLSFSQYDGAKKLSILVVEDSDVNAEVNSNVVYLSAGSAAIYGFASQGTFNTFKFDANIANQTIKMGDTILVQGEDDKYAAYNIWGVEPTADAGIYTVSYTTPAYDEIYDKFVATSSATLEDGTVAYANAAEAVEYVTEAVSAVGFNAGPVRVDANKDGDTVTLKIQVEVNDVLGEKDGPNSLALVLTFEIASQIEADTNINIGALVKKEDNDISIKADFKNTLTFGVEVKDGVAISEGSELDAIITKIKKLVTKDENAVSIPVFNWIVPIGNGVADVNFQVNAVMDFTFSGKLGVESSATAGFAAEVKYNPATGEKSAQVYKADDFSIDSVSINLDANAAIYLGIEAAIKFELLGGVLSVGVGAEVGNYNRIYGRIETTNLLLEDKAALYGYYFEGGIYYDVKFLYSLANIKSGDISFLKGRQEKQLYEAGSQYLVTYLADSNMTISTVGQDVAMNCTYKNIVTGEVVTDLVKIVDPSKVKEVEEQSANNYVEIVDGKIALTAEGLANIGAISNYQVKVIADGATAYITVNAVETIEAQVGAQIDVTGFTGAKVVTAEYADGTAIDGLTFTSTTARFTAPDAGIVVVKVNGVVYAIYNVA